MLFVGWRDGLGMRARDWKAGEIPGEDRVRWLCDAGKEELTRGGPGVSGATAERKTRRRGKWAPTSGPGVAAGRVARGAEERWLAGLMARAR